MDTAMLPRGVSAPSITQQDISHEAQPLGVQAHAGRVWISVCLAAQHISVSGMGDHREKSETVSDQKR
jgi:hypothetical protein